MIIAIGANLSAPDGTSPLQACDRAVRTLASLPGLSGIVRSRWYSSAPVPPSGQPRYINGVVRAGCTLSPAALLAALQAVEQASGRQRTIRDAARTLDLDVIDAGGLVQANLTLILPHPRAHTRGFVLYPLRDVAPDWVHPSFGHSIAALLAALPSDDIHPL